MAGVALTLGLYRSGRAVLDIPIWRMIAAPLAGVQARAECGRAGDRCGRGRRRSRGDRRWWLAPRRDAAVGRRAACRRGPRRGSLPRLRAGQPAVIGRIEDGRVVLDLRTVDPGADASVAAAVTAALASRRVTVVVGTAGHIDHGKTRLLHALTGIDADRLPEEQRRGMTIDVGYAHLDSRGRHIDRFRRRPRSRQAGRQHARRSGRDRCGDARRRRRRRPARADA